MTEIWRNIPGYHGRYQASTSGKIRSTPRISHRGTTELHLKGKVLSPGETRKGYLQVHLYTNGKPVKYYIEQLIAKTFIPNPRNLSETSHIDEDKHNNSVSNLEWCTRKYNVNYGHRSMKAGISSGKAVTLSKNDKKYTFPSMTTSAQWLIDLGYSTLSNPKQMVTSISDCANHKPNHNTLYGFIVEWAGEENQQEVWKDIPGYVGLYQVSNKGRVRRKGHFCYVKRYMPSRVLHPEEDKDGYFRVGLYRHRHQSMHRINRLVAEAFIPNPHNYVAVNHRNEDRKDNRPKNLEWCTTNYNNHYGHRQERLISYNGHALKLMKNGRTYKFPTMISAVRWIKSKHNIQCGLHGMRNHLRQCLHHRYGHNRIYGYTPRFLDDKWVALPICALDA